MEKLEVKEVDDLKLIKIDYGEEMAHKCKDLFPTILVRKGLLYSVISKIFAPSKFLIYDIMFNDVLLDFENYIYYCTGIEPPEKKEIVEKTPAELLDEAGYILYECKPEEKIYFQRYYG